MRLHIIGLPHTATNKSYCGCAFTQKVLNMCKMMKMMGYEVIHYGNEGSEVECDENVVILKKDKILSPVDVLKYSQDNNFTTFNYVTIGEIMKRAQKNDFLLCAWPLHKEIADRVKDMIIVESGIGYPSGQWAPFKVFESYAVLHAYYGLKAVEKADKFEWYSHVIPNYFDPADFTYGEKPKDYVFFLGMRHGGYGKGYGVAVDACRDADRRLIVAGPEAPKDKPDWVEYIGLIDVETRKKYLSEAYALIAPSLFLEPFCGAHIEAFMCGTPVISTDWGAFTEYNIHGKTGFRCHTHKEFVEAIKNARNISRYDCYEHSKQFELKEVGKRYDAYFNTVMKVFTDKGWYA